MPFDLEYEYILGLLAWIGSGAVAIVLLLKLRRRWGKTALRRVKWANAGLSLWMFLAALTAVELFFAIVYDQSDSFNMSNVSKHWFARHVRKNEEGFRDSRPFPKRIPDGMRRVCFIGDSFTFGHGIKDVADRFSDRVGARLEAARPGTFLVSNVGEAGIDVRLATNIVKEAVGHGYQIDVVVYTICLNDIEGYDPNMSDHSQRLGLHAPKFFLFRDTYFLNMLYFRIQQANLPLVRNYYSELAESYRSDPWDRMCRKLDELWEICKEQKIDLRIAIFPFLHNLGPEYPFDAAHERIAEYCRKTGVLCLDLKPALLPHIGEGLTVNRFDAHPNERAHALAAEAIEQGLLADLFARQP
jgi:lysophospholipase L1-like esterase